MDYTTADHDPGAVDFYDTWVFRDRDGNPWGSFAYSNWRQLQSGKPLQVGCCWNGAAALSPIPFIAHDVRFRRSRDGVVGCPVDRECSASECSLLCKDFARNGFHRVLAVPSMRVAYDLGTYQLLPKPPPREALAAMDRPIEWQPLSRETLCWGIVRPGSERTAKDCPQVWECLMDDRSAHRRSGLQCRDLPPAWHDVTKAAAEESKGGDDKR
uniref:Uncharacterized protein n=1 Tax=Vitrella brassicaformis TaxID=1169539 RepID=A0A7S1K2U2_9ALVE|mmetsp:Transcript_35890/g.89430  ORF Transcript_35890/g.89430 Transcript_35890/m.89430 type:complete len:213 (+) Transcript_35890:457-1095(+)